MKQPPDEKSNTSKGTESPIIAIGFALVALISWASRSWTVVVPVMLAYALIVTLIILIQLRRERERETFCNKSSNTTSHMTRRT